MGEYSNLTDQALKDMVDSLEVDMRIDPKHMTYLIQEALSRMIGYKQDISWSVQAGITASATQTQGQQPLTETVNEISVCGTIGDVVTLPPAAPGLVCIVANNGANAADIYPATGDDAGGGVNTAVALAAAAVTMLVALDATTWQALF